MAFANASNYPKFQIIKRLTFLQDSMEVDIIREWSGKGNIDKEINIPGKVLGFNYYESIYSPMVTASFLMQSTGGDTFDEDDFAGTLKDAAKIRGQNNGSNQSGSTFVYLAMAEIGGNGRLPPIYGR